MGTHWGVLKHHRAPRAPRTPRAPSLSSGCCYDMNVFATSRTIISSDWSTGAGPRAPTAQLWSYISSFMMLSRMKGDGSNRCLQSVARSLNWPCLLVYLLEHIACKIICWDKASARSWQAATHSNQDREHKSNNLSVTSTGVGHNSADRFDWS